MSYKVTVGSFSPLSLVSCFLRAESCNRCVHYSIRSSFYVVRHSTAPQCYPSIFMTFLLQSLHLAQWLLFRCYSFLSSNHWNAHGQGGRRATLRLWMIGIEPSILVFAVAISKLLPCSTHEHIIQFFNVPWIIQYHTRYQNTSSLLILRNMSGVYSHISILIYYLLTCWGLTNYNLCSFPSFFT